MEAAAAERALLEAGQTSPSAGQLEALASAGSHGMALMKSGKDQDEATVAAARQYLDQVGVNEGGDLLAAHDLVRRAPQAGFLLGWEVD